MRSLMCGPWGPASHLLEPHAPFSPGVCCRRKCSPMSYQVGKLTVVDRDTSPMKSAHTQEREHSPELFFLAFNRENIPAKKNNLTSCSLRRYRAGTAWVIKPLEMSSVFAYLKWGDGVERWHRGYTVFIGSECNQWLLSTL